jgi:hypothetical protein
MPQNQGITFNMGLGHSPSIVVDGLVFMIDPNNTNSYSGYGNTVYNLVNPSIGGTFVGYTSNPIDNTENRTIFFDGTNDFIPIGSLGSFYTQGTISFWMKSSDITANYRNPFATNYNGSNVNVIRFEQGEGAGALKCWFGDPSGSIASLNYSAISANTWYNVVLTWNQSTTTVTGYLNGILDVANSSWIRWPTSFANVGIGLGYNSRYFKGNIGQVQIYNRALSATEILQNFNATKKKYSPEENIVTNGLVLNIDAANSISYSGIGNTWYDITGNARNFSLNNGPTFSSYNSGLIRFDGTNDNAEISYTITFSPITVIVWFNSKSYSSASFLGGLISNYDNATNGFDIRKQGANLLLSLVTDAAIGNINVINTVADNTWYNIAFTYNGASLISYTNGLPIATTALTGTRRNGARIALATSAYDFPTRVYACDISQILIYNRALTQQEILQNYNATKNRFINALPPVRNGLVLELDAGQRASYPGTGNTWYDLSGNSLNGTLTNGPTFSGIGATSSIVFDRSNDYVLVGDSSLLSTFTGMTLEIIVKYTSTNDQIFVQKWNYALGNDGYTLELLSSAIVGACYSGGGTYLFTSVSNYPINNIYHIVFTLNGSTQTMYINGVLVATNSSGSVPITAGKNLMIGQRSSAGTYFGGNNYLTKFYNRGLSAYEVKQNFDYYRTRYNI